MQDVINPNQIKVDALNCRLFEQFCEEMDAGHKRLLSYTEVRWLSKSRSLARIFQLQENSWYFLLPLPVHFCKTIYIAKFAYLCDIFNLFNDLNFLFKRKMTAVFLSVDKVAAFKAKLELWRWWENTGIIEIFYILAGIMKKLDCGLLLTQLMPDSLTSQS